MRNIRLVQLDGKMPNIALMKLACWHRQQGDGITLTRSVQPSLFEPGRYDTVYGSAIFRRSKPLLEELQRAYPEAIVGGTGTWADPGPNVPEPSGLMALRTLTGHLEAVPTEAVATEAVATEDDAQALTELTVEEHLGLERYEQYDYSIYPGYPWSIGFTQRGCRLRCAFCVVPRKEGRPAALNTIQDIWRPGTERNVVLLDNDFFGQPRGDWQARMDELREGRFRVSFNQGINIRLIDGEAAHELSQLRYYNHKFNRRRLYTAWDNIGQERIFFRGVELLREAGIPPQHLMVYMLTGFAEGETIEQVMHRYQGIRNKGCLAFPMVYGDQPEAPGPSDPDREERTERLRRYLELKRFQRWVIQRYDQFLTWEEFGRAPEPDNEAPALDAGDL